MLPYSSGFLNVPLSQTMASTRTAASLRSALRIALARPVTATRLYSRPAICARSPNVPYVHNFGTVGVRWEKSAGAKGTAPLEPKKWDFDMVSLDGA